MTTQNPSADSLKGPSNAELSAAKILAVLREGYHLADLRADLPPGDRARELTSTGAVAGCVAYFMTAASPAAIRWSSKI